MTTITITDQTSTKESTRAVTARPYATASIGGDRERALVPLFVPASQAYYWTLDWQRAEARALRELAEGHGRRFASGAAAAEWLLAEIDDA
jgi:hypothetical protein